MNAEFLEAMEAYLAGRLSRTDLEHLAREAGVTDLDQELQWLRDTQTALEAEDLRDQLEGLLPQQPATTRIRRLRPTTWAMVAASVALLVLAGWWFTRSSATDLYAQYEFVDPGLPVLMSDTQNYRLQEALTYYSEGNYREAIRRLEALPASYQTNDTLQYFLGASYLYSGQPETALPFLENLDDTTRFREKAQWLTVLIALRQKNWPTARRRAQPIAERTDHPFQPQAQQLLQDLNDR